MEVVSTKGCNEIPIYLTGPVHYVFFFDDDDYLTDRVAFVVKIKFNILLESPERHSKNQENYM